ncbi:DUF2189 domain-containing protein [Ideonella sp. A 288]|uniref:DUF2189 domain-containing protein n=1 Tax=Ideonella sp. A 288 TaxID=1962181 RepID=UPI000B4B8C19|nr:DUF2189 domain-containing protein [Ideonella sp. A 288]
MPTELTTALLKAAAQPPVVAPAPGSAPREIVPLSWADPFHWLRLGWRDVVAHPGTSLFYGLPFWCMAVVLHGLFHKEPEYVMTLVSGCLLAGPFVAMGLYDLSRRREQGQAMDFMASLTCWKPHLRSLGLLVGVLVVLELMWGRVSLVMLALFFDTGLPTSAGLMEAAVNVDNLDFVAAYLVASGLFAMLVFTLSVVSIPMVLDRDTDAITAAILSAEVVGRNTGVMLLWGTLIVAMIVLSLLLMPLALGLAVVGPLLGHASWHAYRGSVRWP